MMCSRLCSYASSVASAVASRIGLDRDYTRTAAKALTVRRDARHSLSLAVQIEWGFYSRAGLSFATCAVMGSGLYSLCSFLPTGFEFSESEEPLSWLKTIGVVGVVSAAAILDQLSRKKTLRMVPGSNHDLILDS